MKSIQYDKFILFLNLCIHSKITIFRARQWRPVTNGEMKLFIAISMAMGLVSKQDLDAYWSTAEVVETPFFGKYMPRDRYQLILSYLHLSDNSTHVSINFIIYNFSI